MTSRPVALLQAVWSRPGGRAGIVALVLLALIALIGPFVLPSPTVQGDLLTESLLSTGSGPPAGHRPAEP